jgi:hypothetical protein
MVPRVPGHSTLVLRKVAVEWWSTSKWSAERRWSSRVWSPESTLAMSIVTSTRDWAGSSAEDLRDELRDRERRGDDRRVVEQTAHDAWKGMALSVAACHRRLRALEQAGAIRGC